MKYKCALSHHARRIIDDIGVNSLNVRKTTGLVFVSEVRANIMSRDEVELTASGAS